MSYETAQVVGMAAGFIITGGSPWGAMLGATIAGAMFPPPPIKTEGARLSDLRVQSAEVGKPIAMAWGTPRIAGVLIASDKLREVRTEEEQGAKGGGPSQVSVKYNYFGTFAVALCKGPIVGVRRIWADGKVYYDASKVRNSSSTLPNWIGGLKEKQLTLGPYITVYPGNEEQLPDPALEGVYGAGNVPAHRGMAYVVFDNLPLAEFGNRIPNFEFEIVTHGDIKESSTSFPDLLTDAQVRTDVVKARNSLPYNFFLMKKAGQWFEVRLYRDRQEVSQISLEGTWQPFDTIDRPGLTHFYKKKYLMPASHQPTGRLCLMEYDYEKKVFSAQYVSDLPEHGPENSSWQQRWDGPCIGLDIHPVEDRGMVGLYKRGGYQHTGGYLFRYGKFINYAGPVVPPNPPYHAAIDGAGVWRVMWRNAWNSTAQMALTCTSQGGWGPDAKLEERVSGVAYMEPWEATVAAPGAGGLATHPKEKVVYVVNNTGLYRRIKGSYKFEKLADVPSGLTGMEFTPSGLTFFSRKGDKLAEIETATGQLMGEYAVPTVAGTPGSTRLRFNVDGFVSEWNWLVRTPSMNASAVSVADIFKDVARELEFPLDRLDLSLVEGENSRVQAYVISGRNEAKQGLEPLMMAYACDIVESGKKLRVQPRVSAPYAGRITKDDQGFTNVGSDARWTSTTLQQEFELPATLEVQFANPANAYQTDSVRSQKRNTVSVDERSIAFPQVMSKSYAQGLAHMLLATTWMARTTYKLSVGLKWSHLEPGDVVDIETDSGVRRAIIIKLKWSPSGLIELDCAAFDYSVLDGLGGDPVGEVVVPGMRVKDNPQLLALDLPLLKQADDSPGFYAVAYTEEDQTSDTSVVLRSSGDGFEQVAGISPYGTVGYIADFVSNDQRLTDAVWSDASMLVRLESGDLYNASSTDALWQGRQMFAYEYEREKWAVGSFLNAAVVAEGEYNLTGLVLGQKGTDTHPELGPMSLGYLTPMIGGRFVRLDAAVVRVPQPLEYTGQTHYYRAVAQGNNRESADDIGVANTNQALVPLAPMLTHCTWHEGVLSLAWRRRTRWPAVLRDGVDAPLAEASEQYLVRVWDEVMTTVLKELTVSTASVSISSADIGETGKRVVEVRQVSALAGPGKPYRGLVNLG